MSSQKHTVNQAPAREIAPARTGFGSTLTFADRARLERKARYDRAMAVGAWIGGGVARLVASVRAAHRRRVAMAELSSLDSRMLADIGITHSDIRAAVAGASGFLPRALGTSAAAPSLNDDALNRAA